MGTVKKATFTFQDYGWLREGAYSAIPISSSETEGLFRVDLVSLAIVAVRGHWCRSRASSGQTINLVCLSRFCLHNSSLAFCAEQDELKSSPPLFIFSDSLFCATPFSTLVGSFIRSFVRSFRIASCC